ncbi:MAG: NAD(P)-dependent oxidoreductase [Planctomycetaceae bacterium]
MPESQQTSPATIGFIGTGIMGQSMAGHLMAAGHPLHVFTRTRTKADSLVARGATWQDSVADVARSSEIVITMLGLPQDVEEVYLGEDGLVATARPGSLLIDMTTSSPLLSIQIARAAAARGVTCLDAPVSGGDIGARQATLVIMVGGSPDAFERAKPLFDRLGRSVTLLGDSGSGQRCKLANQVAVAIGMVAWCEALAHARCGGLDPVAVQGVISGGAAGSWALTNLAPRALAGDFAPGFMVRHLVKDVRIALEAARAAGLDLPGLETAARLYERLEQLGHGSEGTQALLSVYDRESGATQPPRQR